MKKLFILFMVVLLSACNRTEPNGKKNENCADFDTIKVLRTFNDGAFARVCDDGDTKVCSGMMVIINKTRHLQLWDEKIVTPPKDKCFYYTSTANIIIDNKNIKTVPVLGFDYKYLGKSVDDAFERAEGLLMDHYFPCEYHFEHGDPSLKEEGLKFCDCEKQAGLDDLDDLDASNPSQFEEHLEQCAKKYPKAKADIMRQRF